MWCGDPPGAPNSARLPVAIIPSRSQTRKIREHRIALLVILGNVMRVNGDSTETAVSEATYASYCYLLSRRLVANSESFTRGHIKNDLRVYDPSVEICIHKSGPHSRRRCGPDFIRRNRSMCSSSRKPSCLLDFSAMRISN